VGTGAIVRGGAEDGVDVVLGAVGVGAEPHATRNAKSNSDRHDRAARVVVAATHRRGGVAGKRGAKF
jgi:hypothetical protein